MSYARPSLSQVVPFSQRSGVLEWCSGTVPIGEFLVDPQKGAHGRFRPRDWTNLACRKKMMVSAELLSLPRCCWGLYPDRRGLQGDGQRPGCFR